MKTLRLKSILFGLMALFAVSIVMTSCEQDPLEGITEETLKEMTPEEKRADIKLVPASEEDYIEGQLYVKLKDAHNTSFKSTSRDVDIAQLPFLNNLKNDHNFDVKSTFYFAKSPKLNRTLRVYLDDAKQTEALMRELENNDEVEYVERVPAAKTSFTPNDLGSNTYSGQWGLHKIQAQAAWDITKGSGSVVVAVVDDAVMTTHPDLVGQTVTGRDVSDDDNNTNPSTNLAHGTHVAGIVGARTNNGTGVASIGYNIKIMPIKATPDNGVPGYVYDGYEGITWAVNNGADVINMSWGGPSYSQTAANIISNASSQGVVLVASAGNSNSSTTNYPAGYPNVISVANTDINDNKASTSSYGPTVDVSAPGTSIRSTVISGGYQNWSGTSMASPMVAGLCGLVLSANPALTPAQVENCIKSTADPLSNSTLGAGRINALKAVQCANPGGGGGGCDTPSASEITYGDYGSYIYLYAFNYSGVSHQFRYRVNGGAWIELAATSNYYNYISAQPGAGYEVELKLCDDNWSNTKVVRSPSGGGGGNCDTPSTSDITYGESSSLIYIYAHSYHGDTHQFRYRFNGGAWQTFSATTSHYNTIYNKQCGTYQVQLRQKCGNTWSDWSNSKSIVSCQ